MLDITNKGTSTGVESLKVRGEMSVSFDNNKIKCSANNVNYNHNKLSENPSKTLKKKL